MKTSALILTGVLIATLVSAQNTVITSAPTIEAAINTSAADLNAKLTQLLNEAKTQNERLQTSLDRMGDPAAVNLPSIQLIERDIQDSAASLKTRDEQRAAIAALTGAEVFDNDAGGVMTPIGATVTKEDGTVVDRDPELYRMEAAMTAQVEEYNNVREKALERKKILKEEEIAVMKDLDATTDQASILKLKAMLTLLQTQIAECNQTILISQADAEMMEKELIGQARVMSKASQEERNLNNSRDPDAPPQAGAFPGLGAAPRKLPWGRKGGTDTGTDTPVIE